MKICRTQRSLKGNGVSVWEIAGVFLVLTVARLYSQTTFLVPAGQTETVGTPVTSGPVTVGDSTNTGALILTNSANTYPGGTTINFATLQVTAETALGDPSGSVTLSNRGVLDFNLAVVPPAGTIESRPLTLTSGGGGIQAEQVILLEGGISGNGNLTVTSNGAGAFFAEIANSYVGRRRSNRDFMSLKRQTVLPLRAMSRLTLRRN
jgi:hypothetical protein